jgi:hypothetical protein
MRSDISLCAAKLVHLAGAPLCAPPADGRTGDMYDVTAVLIPGAAAGPQADPSAWAGEFPGPSALFAKPARNRITMGRVSSGSAEVLEGYLGKGEKQ